MILSESEFILDLLLEMIDAQDIVISNINKIKLTYLVQSF